MQASTDGKLPMAGSFGDTVPAAEAGGGRGYSKVAATKSAPTPYMTAENPIRPVFADAGPCAAPQNIYGNKIPYQPGLCQS